MWNSLTLPWRFTALLRSTRHVNCYSYHACTSVTISGRGRNAIVHDPKPLTQNRLLLNTCMDTNMQLTINNFRQFSITRFFSLTIPWLLVKSWHFPDSCQIPWHFQVFQTSGHPGCQILWPKCTKFDFGWGPRPRWWSLQCSPSIGGGERAVPKNVTPTDHAVLTHFSFQTLACL